ncbi:unnamed protein product [Cylindrotheca closterium]|uniref:Uncharacterized protein n=1 Tax=Cylindrotheca closterium TaxID=2856 RepID=A0AAD2FYE6_9STRA|nr:unnamed protein product [Cylindrotheca closterium]
MRPRRKHCNTSKASTQTTRESRIQEKVYGNDSRASSEEDLEYKEGECRRQEKVYDNSSSVSSDEDREHKEAVNVG